MKLIIDIPEKVYSYVNTQWRDIPKNDSAISIMCNAIIDSTVLPRHHGRLIDYEYVVDAIDDWISAEEYKYTNATDYLRKRIKNAPTIIEADEEINANDRYSN